MTDAAGVDLHIHPDVAAFDARARHLFDADPVRHTLAHTGLDRMRAGTLRPELLLTVGRRGEVIGAVLRGQGRPLVVSGMPVTCASAVDAVAARTDPQPPGAIGPVRGSRRTSPRTSPAPAGTQPWSSGSGCSGWSPSSPP